MEGIKDFKKKLAVVFDNDLKTTVWSNYLDYFIISCIILSTISIFVSTLNIPPTVESTLQVIDIFTVIVFTIEVSLRIWVADIIDPRFKGIWGRIRYCFTFFGFIDVVSTYSFYIAMFLPLPYSILKALRVLRLLRVFRYMRSFRLLQEAITSKSKEMLISLQFLVIVTLMLSFILFFYENSAQPNIYSDGLTSIVWAFVQYIGDPGGFAEAGPITFAGKIIACIISILSIALFAVPAGLIGAGFSEAIEKDIKKEEIKENTNDMKKAFERKLDRPTGFQVVPPYLSIIDIQTRLGMKVDDIMDVVENSNEFRLINLAQTHPIDEHPTDKLAVEHFMVNRPYGCCIDRGSKITIISPSNISDPCIGNFSYYLALIGGFNYISREIGELCPYKSYYAFTDRDTHEENLAAYMNELENLTSREGSWTLTSLVASGILEPEYPTQFHFSAGGKKGDESFEGDNLLVQDMATYRAFYEDLSAELKTKFNLDSDHQKYHGATSSNIFARRYSAGKECKNNILLRTAWSACLWDSNRISIAKTIADAINKHLNSGNEIAYDAELKVKRLGY